MLIFIWNSEALNAPECDAIHITEIETRIECDTFIPSIDSSVFQPWYSSFPIVENNIRYCLSTYVRVRSAAVESLSQNNDIVLDSKTNSDKFEVKQFSFLPKMVFEKHEEYLYLRLVQDIISDGNLKDDRTGTGTLSKFGCQVMPSSYYQQSFSTFASEVCFRLTVLFNYLWKLIFFSNLFPTDAVQFAHNFSASYNQGMSILSIFLKLSQVLEIEPTHGVLFYFILLSFLVRKSIYNKKEKKISFIWYLGWHSLLSFGS